MKAWARATLLFPHQSWRCVSYCCLQRSAEEALWYNPCRGLVTAAVLTESRKTVRSTGNVFILQVRKWWDTWNGLPKSILLHLSFRKARALPVLSTTTFSQGLDQCWGHVRHSADTSWMNLQSLHSFFHKHKWKHYKLGSLLPLGLLHNSPHCTATQLHVGVCSWTMYHRSCSRNVIIPN